MGTVYVADGRIYIEDTSEILPLDQLDAVLTHSRYAASWVVGNGIGGYLTRVHNFRKDDPEWTITVRTPKTPQWPWPHTFIHGMPQITRMGYGSVSHRKSRAHTILDFSFFHKTARDAQSMNEIVALFASLRSFAHYEDIRLKNSAAGLGMQMLKAIPDIALETQGQQKFARAAIARPLVNLYAKRRQRYARALYLDQTQSWHRCAAAINPPRLSEWIDEPPTKDSRAIAERLSINGVHEVTLKDGSLTRLAANNGSLGIWSPGRSVKEVNEWHRAIGGYPVERHPIQDYASRAIWMYENVLKDRDMVAEQAVPVIKAVLLSVYGLLGLKPVLRVSQGHIKGKQSQTHEYSIGGETLTLATFEQRIAFKDGNAMILAMLRDEMHRRTVRFARRLRGLGHTVLAIFDDGIIVDATDNRMLPLTEGWIIKHELKDVVFFDEHNWMGDRIVRLGSTHVKQDYFQEYKTLIQARSVEDYD